MSLVKNFLDGGFGEAQKKNEATSAWLKNIFQQSASAGESMLMKALAKLDAQSGVAQNELGKAGEVATQQILGQGKQALAAGQQALINSGFGGTIAAQLPGQVASQTNQALASLAEGLGAQKANLALNYGQAQLVGAQNFANWALNKTGMANATATQYQAQGGGFLQGLGQAAGKAVGTWAGGFLPG